MSGILTLVYVFVYIEKNCTAHEISVRFNHTSSVNCSKRQKSIFVSPQIQQITMDFLRFGSKKKEKLGKSSKIIHEFFRNNRDENYVYFTIIL